METIIDIEPLKTPIITELQERQETTGEIEPLIYQAMPAIEQDKVIAYCKEQYLKGEEITAIRKQLLALKTPIKVELSSIYRWSKQFDWEDQRTEILIEADRRLAKSIAKDYAERKKQYKGKVSLRLEKHLNTIDQLSNPVTLPEIKAEMTVLEQIHAVAKDIYDLDKQSDAGTNLNVVFLSGFTPQQIDSQPLTLENGA